MYAAFSLYHLVVSKKAGLGDLEVLKACELAVWSRLWQRTGLDS